MAAARRTSTIIVNPSARNIGRFDARRAVRILDRYGIDTTVLDPRSPADAAAAARGAAARRDDLVFAVGGDGALRAVAEGVHGSPSVLAAIPAGTTNVWAREIGLPLDPMAAFAIHAHGQAVEIDLGLANGTPYVLMAGIGWDGEVVRRTKPGLKRATGPIAYAAEFAVRAPALRPRWVRWIADGTPFVDNVGIMVLSNTRLYGGFTSFNPQAMADDGMLDVCAFCPRGMGDGIRNGLRMLAGRLTDNDAVRMQRVRELTIATPGIPLQLDGDSAGTTPTTFTIAPRALRVSLPPGRLPPMFASNGAHPGR